MDRFFKDAASKYVFILTHTDSHVRCNLLKITLDLYYDKSKLDNWYNEIYNVIKDYPDDYYRLLSYNTLLDIYNRIVKCFDDEEEEYED